MIVQCKEEVVEKNGYPQTEMQHNDPAQYTVLGWVKMVEDKQRNVSLHFYSIYGNVSSLHSFFCKNKVYKKAEPHFVTREKYFGG